MIPDNVIRHKVWRGLNTDEVAEPNVFAIDATVAAFTEGEEWLEELRSYLSENKQFAGEYLEKNLPQVKVVPSKATYLLWLDCRGIIGDATELAAFIRRDSGLYLSAGSEYGKNGKDFLRMNIACPKERLMDGLERFCKSVPAYEKWAVKLC